MRRALQIITGLLSLLPLSFGLVGIIFGVGRLQPDFNVNLDSQFRFLSAWYFGLGLISLWIIPRIESHTTLFRIITMAVFIGGLARIASLLQYGLPEKRFLIVMAAELLFPLLIPWQAAVAKRSSESKSGSP